ncbi:MAG: histidinol-phosphate transaminase [Chloroflexi bacterium]|nr:histidinol-phosphate transaminase [Chloroflexota bacterium]
MSPRPPARRGEPAVKNPGRSSPAIDRLERRDLRDLKPYEPIMLPGTLPQDAAIDGGAVVKLDGNENVYGCSPRVAAALRSYDQYHIYPDPEQRDLRQALADYANVDAASVLAGAGSDEVIDLLLRLVLEPGDSVITCVPTFGMYAFNTQVCGGRAIEVPRDERYQIDVRRVVEAIEPATKVIFIASPNNPTGTVTDRGVVEELLDTGRLVVVDEAYYEFSGVTMADLVSRVDNLVVLRTFSKWAGLAGLRIGYGIMSPAFRERLMVIKPPYNISAAAQVAALESLGDIEYLMSTVRALVTERDRLYHRLQQIGFLEPVPSQANFVLSHVSGLEAVTLQRELRKRGIYIRHFDTPLLKNSIRISAGKPEHTDAVIDALKTWEG